MGTTNRRPTGRPDLTDDELLAGLLRDWYALGAEVTLQMDTGREWRGLVDPEWGRPGSGLLLVERGGEKLSIVRLAHVVSVSADGV